MISLVLFLVIVAVVAWREARRVVFGWLVTAAQGLARPLRRDPEAVRRRLAVFEEELHEGVDFLIASGTRMWSPIFWIWLDWFLMLATLYASFWAINEPVSMGVVVIGFAIGIFLSFVNLVPGGLGIMEGSMAAVFTGLGVPLETAVVATLLYRFFYYALPLLVSLLFLRDLLLSRDLDPRSAPLAPTKAR